MPTNRNDQPQGSARRGRVLGVRIHHQQDAGSHRDGCGDVADEEW